MERRRWSPAREAASAGPRHTLSPTSGASVLCTDIDEATAEKTAAECQQWSPWRGGAHRAYRLDVADRAEVDAVAARVDKEYGALTVLVNNAGVGMTGSYARMTAEEWAFIRADQPRRCRATVAQPSPPPCFLPVGAMSSTCPRAWRSSRPRENLPTQRPKLPYSSCHYVSVQIFPTKAWASRRSVPASSTPPSHGRRASRAARKIHGRGRD